MSDLLRRIDLRFDFVAEKMRQHRITESGCWEYAGYIKPTGYASMKIYVNHFRPQKRTFMVHRVSYAFHSGEDPGELFVCHHCDNPSCINPDHLFLGTPLVNTRDMLAKGRGAVFSGENNPRSRLSEAVVADVVDQIKSGKTNKEIALLLPVSHAQVSLIRLGKSWRPFTESLGYDPDDYRKFVRKAA